MGPAIKMGRTFIRTEYQKHYSSLLLLWKGTGKYLSINPRYRVLFGAVSISNEYQLHSRQLMVKFLKMNRFSQDLSRMVKPRKPFREKRIAGLNREKAKAWWDDINELSSCISSLEADGKGVPILLKQYLKMGGMFLSFNLDYDFARTLDGLFLLDLVNTDQKVLERYMGADGFRAFMKYHLERCRNTKAPSLLPLEQTSTRRALSAIGD